MTIAEGLAASAQRLPDKVALIFQDQRVTYAALNERVDLAAAAFQTLGLVPGERVALLLGNAPYFVEAFYGALRAGLIVVPVNTAFTADETAFILADSGTKAVVVGEPFVGTLHGVRETLPALEEVIVAGATSSPSGAQSWAQFLAAAGEPKQADVDGDAVALLQYTSGTTGRPRGAMLTHANLLANHRQMDQTRIGVDESDVVLCVLPLFHIYALNVAMAFTLARGATILLLERFDALQTLSDITRHEASVVLGAPPMYVAWVNTPGVETHDLGSVRFAISGAAPLPRQILERFTDQLGIPIWEGYGLTETAPVLTTTAMRDEPKPGSVGRPLPEVALRLVNERGEPVSEGDPGEVVVRGPNIFVGYWHDEEATKEVLDDAGWFATGDVGYADAEGDLFLVDRKRDLIIVSGFNVYPREVEEVLYRHPKVAEAAVVGAPHPYTGECVKAVIVLRPGEEATADEIIDFAHRSLARFKAPEVVEFARELPHAASGKVLRRELRDGS
jgi:long-chain acyl-CoA synthetase